MDTTLVASEQKDNKKMNSINVAKVELVKQEQDTILNVTLCNENTEIYYLEKRRLPYHFSDITEYYISQDGKDIKTYRRSPKRRLLPSKFPDGYVSIEPNNCITLETKLNDFFHFDPNKPLTISCHSYNVHPNTSLNMNSLDLIQFEKTLIVH